MLKHLALWVPALAVISAITLASGCSLDEVITVDVPRDVQKTMGTGDTVNLREARQLREQLVERQAASVRAFDREIADGAFQEELGGMVINDVLPIAIPAVGELPGGTVLVGLITGIAGLMTRRPGDGGKLKEAEDKGYDMGRTEAAELLKN